MNFQLYKLPNREGLFYAVHLSACAHFFPVEFVRSDENKVQFQIVLVVLDQPCVVLSNDVIETQVEVIECLSLQ